MDNRKISLCIPYFNRSELILSTINYPLLDDRIDEIIIYDDRSSDEDYYRMLDLVKDLPKVKVVRTVVNFHVQHAKRNAISFAKNDWVICLDNDNQIEKDFVDKIFQMVIWNAKTIYHSTFAEPHFRYTHLNGAIITKENVASFCHDEKFMTLLNFNNYFVNKFEYLKSYKYNSECRGSDGLYNNYNWLLNGNKIYMVPDLKYFHLVHPGSEFLREAESNMTKIYFWFNMLKQLK